MKISNIDGTFTLHNGVKMPYLGLGVFQSEEGSEVVNAVKHAIRCGYRHIDTASMYKNEVGVGKGVRESSIPRSDVFVTTKLWNSDHGYDSTMKAFEQSLNRLGFDYIDLYLIHWPVAGKFNDTWKAFEEIYASGRAKAIGVSNFHVHHIQKLMETASIKPMVNQIEFHPELQQPSLTTFCKENEIQVQAWSPLMRGKVAEMKELTQIGEKYGKTPVQVALRWNLQNGIITIPKSVKQDRIENNSNIFDFEISNEDMKAIDALDKNARLGPDPDNFNF